MTGFFIFAVALVVWLLWKAAGRPKRRISSHDGRGRKKPGFEDHLSRAAKRLDRQGHLKGREANTPLPKGSGDRAEISADGKRAKELEEKLKLPE